MAYMLFNIQRMHVLKRYTEKLLTWTGFPAGPLRDEGG